MQMHETGEPCPFHLCARSCFVFFVCLSTTHTYTFDGNSLRNTKNCNWLGHRSALTYEIYTQIFPCRLVLRSGYIFLLSRSSKPSSTTVGHCVCPSIAVCLLSIHFFFFWLESVCRLLVCTSVWHSGCRCRTASGVERASERARRRPRATRRDTRSQEM